MSDLIKLGCLWNNKKGEGLNGYMGDYARFVITPNKNKKGPKSPDYWVFLAPSEPKEVDTSAPQQNLAPSFDANEEMPF